MRFVIAASTLLAATALSGTVFAPVGAHAQPSRQATGDQTEFRQGVQARHPTYKRRQIIRSELNGGTNGYGGPRLRHY